MHAMLENQKADQQTGTWRLETDADGVAWLHMDRPQAGTNTLSHWTLQELNGVLSQLAQSPPRGLIILSDKPSGFIAGADVTEFTQLESRQQALEAIRLGQSVFNRLEAMPFPTLALIHGFCLGGGLELALACRYRVAQEDATVGLPEVNLGIHPGFGGSMRLPRLIGAPRAFDLILSGRSVKGRQARRLGIVDAAVPERQMRRAARALVTEQREPHKPAAFLRLLNWRPIRQVLAWYLRRKVTEKANPLHYPAPFAQIDAWAWHGGNDMEMLDAEAESIADLVTSDTAKNLIRCFFLRERLKAIGKDAKDALEARHVHVVGAGAMGGDIAAWCALRGLRVTLQDQRPEPIAQAIKRAAKLYERRLRDPRLVRAALDRLTPDMTGAGIPKAQVIIEAIVEKVDAKQAVFKELEAKANPSALLATNTSSIPLETIAESMDRPDRLIGLHFFNPVAKMPLVEVVEGGNSGEESLQQGRAFAAQIDRLPLSVKSTPGFLVNRILMPYLLEAVVLEGEGVPVSTIDKAATDFGMPMGPLMLADTVGLDICLSVAEVLAGSLDVEIPDRLRSLVAGGHLGSKSGQGFYVHGGKGKAKPVESEDRRRLEPEEVQDRLMLRLLNEARACLREKVVDDEDLLDAGMVFGTGFAPFRGGPMHWNDAHEKGWAKSRLRELRAKYGARFTPDPGWA